MEKAVRTYTAKVNATGTLTGVPATGDGSITATHEVGVNVWQNAETKKRIKQALKILSRV